MSEWIKLLFYLIVCFLLCKIIAHLTLGESSKPQSPQKAHLLGKLGDAKRRLTHKDEEMRQLVERMKRLEETRERQARE